jgi:hypothetical protein
MLAVCKPGELVGKFVAAAQGRRDRHGKVVAGGAGAAAFNAAEMIDIGDHMFADLRRSVG